MPIFAEFKTKIVMELLEGKQTLNQIASKYEVLPKNLQEQKRQFLSVCKSTKAFEPTKVVKKVQRYDQN